MRRGALLASALLLAGGAAAAEPELRLERLVNEELQYVDYCGVGLGLPGDELNGDDTRDEKYLFVSSLVDETKDHPGWLKIDGQVVEVTLPAKDKWFPVKDNKFAHVWKGKDTEVRLDAATTYIRDKVHQLKGKLTIKKGARERTIPVEGFLWAYCWNL